MVIGRFAPTPSWRMHLGNIMCALAAYLSVRREGGRFLLRIEDLDKARCPSLAASQILADLQFLGLKPDGEVLYQSEREGIYAEYLNKLIEQGLTYPCFCSRADLHAATAPHGSDGRLLYSGRCRPNQSGVQAASGSARQALRLIVPNRTITINDELYGEYSENLATDCTDFIVRRADGVHAYQLAVVVDDALTGITEVVRGRDLISSAPRQTYIQQLLGFNSVKYRHVPLLLSDSGERLSKRSQPTDVQSLVKRGAAAEQIIGILAHCMGLIDEYYPISAERLIPLFDWKKLKTDDIRLNLDSYL